MQKNIYDVTMINEEISDKLSIDGDFIFDAVKLRDSELLSLHNETKRFDGGFIHFERVYQLEDGVMLRLSMGNFDRPEHLYLIVQTNRVSYYPNLPLKSKGNLNAHQFLKKVLNG